jgi:ATP-binding cassette ChvD family protein
MVPRDAIHEEAIVQWIYQLNRASVVRGDKVVLDDVTLSFLPGAKIGVVGPNGSGKSTLLRVMAGLMRPFNGDARPAPGISVGFLEQEPVLDESKTVLGNVRDGVTEILALRARYESLAARIAEDCREQLIIEMGSLQDQLDMNDAWDLDARLKQAMDALCSPPPDVEVRDLSGGERRRVALCRLLIARPHLLLLDEPTNHLDAESVQWLEQYLATYLGTVVAVTHDRYFLGNVSEWIVELDRGRAYSYEGNYASYLHAKAARLRIEGRVDARRVRQVQRELEWVRCTAVARQVKTSARLRRYEEMALAAVKTRRLDFDEIRIPPGPRLGALVIEAGKVSKSFGDRDLFRDLSFSLPRNGIVGVVGPNGVGKSTLLHMIAGDEQPDTGTIRRGDTVRIAYVDQNRVGINPNLSAWEAVSDGEEFLQIGSVEVPSRAYLAAFGFKGADQQKPARLFSGGERNRLNLALTLKQGGNVLLLDEPTNDLDIETLASLENAIGEFPGCAVVTAHDRWLLDRLATHILAWEGTETAPAQWYWFEGNFACYEQNRMRRLGLDAPRPYRTTHRKLIRG